MRGEFYVLDGHDVVRLEDADWVDSVRRWGAFFQDTERRIVAQTTIGEVFVSTVFLGIDHAFMGGPPLLFETMVFRGALDERQWRYTTWDLAAAGHDAVVAGVLAGYDPDEVRA